MQLPTPNVAQVQGYCQLRYCMPDLSYAGTHWTFIPTAANIEATSNRSLQAPNTSPWAFATRCFIIR